MKLSLFLDKVDFGIGVTLAESTSTLCGFGEDTIPFGGAMNLPVSSSETSITMGFLSSAFSLEPAERSLEEVGGRVRGSPKV